MVGSAVARKIMEGKPKKVVLTSLFRHEAENICDVLAKEFKLKNTFIPFWGNIFVRYQYKDLSREEILGDPVKRRKTLEDIVNELDGKMLAESSVYKMLQKYKPDLIIDCINTATAIAYQNIYKSYLDILNIAKSKEKNYDLLLTAVEKMICSSYVPQLIRHAQIMYNSMQKFDTKFYFKVGTSGTGGMGLNIPFTHSEEKPSRVLLSKSSVAGAHTLLLFLMARTPDGPLVKEIKPTASIAWKKIKYGEIKRRNRPIDIYDIDPEETLKLKDKFLRRDGRKFKKVGNLKTVYIDTGENGIFSRGEFEAITTNGQMEFVTPEEIAENIYRELNGGNTGNDVINALDGSVMEPSYRAGFLQNSAVAKIKELEEKNKTHSVAFEMLGPPRLSKLLFESHMLRLIYKNFKNVINDTPENISRKVSTLIYKNHKLRNEIVSIGMPVLMPNGKEILRGPDVKIPSENEGEVINLNSKKINKWAHDGWIDLRVNNWKKWRQRLINIMNDADKKCDEHFSSRYVFNKEYWDNFKDINIGKIAGWIFINEEQGVRMKG